MSRLESLPNEILINVFECYDARDLFRACFDLNTRLNQLIQSIDALWLTVTKHEDHLGISSFFACVSESSSSSPASRIG